MVWIGAEELLHFYDPEGCERIEIDTSEGQDEENGNDNSLTISHDGKIWDTKFEKMKPGIIGWGANVSQMTKAPRRPPPRANSTMTVEEFHGLLLTQIRGEKYLL
jgi:hypothetical protein